MIPSERDRGGAGPALSKARTKGWAPDALELEIFRYGVESVLNELEVNITRTAHSPNVYEYKDYVCGIVTRDFRLLSQAAKGMPIFLADLGVPVQDAVETIGEEHIEPGDIFLTNYGPASGSHPSNAMVATPVYLDEQIGGYLTIKAHWPDIGGLVPGTVSSKARSLLHEGIQLRGIKLASRGRLLPEVLATLLANSYLPDLLEGDVLAYVAGCSLGARRWQERIAGRWTAERFDALVEAQFGASAQLARSKVAELPDGEYRASCALDDSGQAGTPPLQLNISIEVKGSRMLVDLSDLPPQVEAPINSGAGGGARSSIRVAFKSLLVPERPADHGLFEPLEIVIPEGTVMSAHKKAPMSYWQQPTPTMIDLFLRAIGERLPELVPAGHFGVMGAVVVSGRDEDGNWWLLITATSGGFGASATADGFGPLPAMTLGDNRTYPIELGEGRYPVRFLSYRLLRNGGRGLHKGGPGVEHVFEVLEPVFLSTVMNRTRDPAWGLAGGEPGGSGAIHIRPPQANRWRRAVWLSEFPLPAGTLVRLRTGGGGGWGMQASTKKSRLQGDDDG